MRLERVPLTILKDPHDARNRQEGDAPLHMACSRSDIATAQLLLENGASVDARDAVSSFTSILLMNERVRHGQL